MTIMVRSIIAAALLAYIRSAQCYVVFTNNLIFTHRYRSSSHPAVWKTTKNSAATTLTKFRPPVNSRLALIRPASRVSTSDASTSCGFEPEEISIIDAIWNAALSSSSQQEPDEQVMEQTLQTFLPQMSPGMILKLRQQQQVTTTTGDDITATSCKIQAIQKALDHIFERKLLQSKDLLHSFLTAGEIRKLDGLIGIAAKLGKLDSSFFAVINANINDAYKEQQQQQNENTTTHTATTTNEEGEVGRMQYTTTSSNEEVERLQILRHIYTRCQEEMEKNVQPGLALLNKLLRTDQTSIRANQLRHYLGKQENIIIAPDGNPLPLPSAAALVPPSELMSALETSVAQIRHMEKVGGTDRTTGASLIESCRQMAMEARLVVGELYGVESKELEDFEDGLLPVFRPERGSMYSPE